MRRVRDKNNNKYYVVRLDQPVDTTRVETGEKWTLREIALFPHFADDSMEFFLSKHDVDSRSWSLLVRLINPMGQAESNDSSLDLSKAALEGSATST